MVNFSKQERRAPPRWLLALPVLVAFAMLSHAAPPYITPLSASIFKNGNFQEANAEGTWPLHWPGGDATYEQENGNRFLRGKSKGPDEMVNLFYLKTDVPQGFENLELKFRARYENVQHGKERWHDARIIINFLDKDGDKTNVPLAGFTGSSDWKWVTHTLSIPKDAKEMEIIPAHFYTASGTFDIGDLWLAGVDPIPPPPTPLTPRDTLVVRGNRVLNKDGRSVWLQGVNIPSLGWWHEGDHVRESVAEALRDWSVNVIRLAVNENFWFGRDPKQLERNATAEEYRNLVDEMIELAAQHGCYTVLDLHGFVAPTQAHAEFWADAAKRYADHPAVLFDLFNEPHGITWKVWRDGGAFTDGSGAEQTSVGMQKLLDVVRGTGAKNIAIVGGLDWGYDLSGVAVGITLAETGGNGIMYSTHIYPWKEGWTDKVLAVAMKHPVFVGEVGCRDKPMEFEKVFVDPYQWAPDVLAFIQKHRLHWAAWSFHTGASPCVISDWNFTPTPYWGSFVRAVLRGARFESERVR